MRLGLSISGLIFIFFLDAGRPSFAVDIGATVPRDPFAYCAAVRDIDTPAGGASPIPAGLKAYLARVLGMAPDSAIVPESYYWRCMSGAVYVCAIGANIPCGTKADRAKLNLGAESYCRENREVKVVPAYAAGHASIYAWSCSGGNAVPGKRLARVDSRGFRVDFWHRVNQSGVPPLKTLGICKNSHQDMLLAAVTNREQTC